MRWWTIKFTVYIVMHHQNKCRNVPTYYLSHLFKLNFCYCTLVLRFQHFTNAYISPHWTFVICLIIAHSNLSKRYLFITSQANIWRTLIILVSHPTLSIQKWSFYTIYILNSSPPQIFQCIIGSSANGLYHKISTIYKCMANSKLFAHKLRLLFHSLQTSTGTAHINWQNKNQLYPD